VGGGGGRGVHLRGLEPVARLERAGAALADAEAAVAERTGLAAGAATHQAEAAAALPARRQAEAEAAAELQRLTLARHALDQEEQRVVAAQAEAAARLGQIEADTVRETAREADAAEADRRPADEEAGPRASAAGRARA